MVTKAELKMLIKEGYSKGYNFQKTLSTANVAERITSQEIDIAIMLLKAKAGNGGKIYVGFDEVLTSSNGMELEASGWISIPIDRADKVFVLTDNATDGVCVICLV